MDPLSPANINEGWSTEPAPSLSAPPVQPPAPPSPSSSTHIRDPQVYGDPGTTIMSSPTASQSDRPAPYLRVRIGGLDRNRKDLLIRYDASTNLANFRTTLYRNMQRSYVEFQRFAEQAQLCCPQTIIPALPPPHTSAATEEEDDRLVRIALQKWFSRICDDPVLQKEDELRSFIESDFGYQPVPPPSARRNGGSSSAASQVFNAALSKVVRRGPLDDDDEIQSARLALEKLEPAWTTAATAVGTLGKARKNLATANTDVGAKLIALATDENDINLATAQRKIGRVYEQLSNMAGAQIASENVILNDSLAYQGLNARSARDALAQRTQILEDSQSATKVAINKRRNVERLKGSSSINPAKVDDAIAEMEEANALDNRLTSHIHNISANLHSALRAHSRNAHEDIAVSLLEHARMSIIFNRQVLRELEALRPDLQRIGSAGPPPPVHVAKPASSPLGPHSAGAPPPLHSPGVPQPAQAPAGSQSMFLPPPGGGDIARPQSAGGAAPAGPLGGAPGPVDPLTGLPVNNMAQSMILPGNRGGAPVRPPARRLDERKAAKLLAGGF
ncbi:Vacuolar protein sorting-associated protein 17 [Vanrija albida]|uniref:Vacuolar protein sorting-associated protein 17 n=1 Tax=Vanrija albida TaxID=181172 RepID=A0ABR3PXV5_9TREE